MIECVKPDNIDELVEPEGFHYRAGDLDDADLFIRRVADGGMPLADVEQWLEAHTSAP